MPISFDLWLDPDDTPLHRRIERELEHYFLERFADYPHIRLPVSQTHDYDAPFNRLYSALIERARAYCLRKWQYSPSPIQLNQAFFRAVSRSPKFIIEDETHPR
ncbi:hypothetical protein [Larsenimonas salina]|uniref:hypothetical protein n=1 Tax=Larsenimonas salina TaxID=1295565 RepID=UPI0020746448|nr:hypothetical protein [Larsenimonas salina]MCM5705553.1 hypothetical protein [Larsenimonas salina]